MSRDGVRTEISMSKHKLVFHEHLRTQVKSQLVKKASGEALENGWIAHGAENEQDQTSSKRTTATAKSLLTCMLEIIEVQKAAQLRLQVPRKAIEPSAVSGE